METIIIYYCINNFKISNNLELEKDKTKQLEIEQNNLNKHKIDTSIIIE